GQRDGGALLGASSRAGAKELGALLAPHPAAAGEHPRRAGSRVVVRCAHDRSVAVGGQRDGEALEGISKCAAADQLGPLLAPRPAAAGKDPGCPHLIAVKRTAYDHGVAIGGYRHGALPGVSTRASADQLGSLLRELRQCRLYRAKQRGGEAARRDKARRAPDSEPRASDDPEIRERMRKRGQSLVCSIRNGRHVTLLGDQTECFTQMAFST